MDEGIAQFQSLSRCEAAKMCEDVTSAILNAYEIGFNTAINNYREPLDTLLEAHRDALEVLGLGHIAVADAFSPMVKKEE